MGVTMPIPLELITMGAGFVASAFTTLFSKSMEKRQAMFEMAITRGQVQAEIYDKVRNSGSKGFQITRRVIALGVIGTILFSTMIAPIFFPDLPITIGLSESTGGFWFFSDPHEEFNWYTFNGGVVMSPLLSHLGYAIAGLFFGNQIAK
jgi:hypothetical protein